MPIYDFYCRGCDRKVNDVLCRGEDTLCPYCGGKMVRMPAAPAIRFKGNGWTGKFYDKGEKK